MRVAVAGAGGMGLEALAWLRDARPDAHPVAFFVADASERPPGTDVALEVVDSVAGLLERGVSGVVLAVGDNRIRAAVAVEVRAAGCDLITVRHPTAFAGPGVVIDDGAVIAPGAILTRDVVVETGVVVNYGAMIGHDAKLAECCFIGPGAVLSGDARVDARAMVGAGAVVLPGIRIGEAARVGAGAVVTRDVALGATVAGVPARSRVPG